MTTKADFSEQEWNLVREGPVDAGMVVASGYIDPEEYIDRDACFEACPVDACFAEVNVQYCQAAS